MGSVGNTLAELKQAVELVSRGIVTTVVDRTLPLEKFQTGINALARSEPLGRVVLLP
jgi:D-arabinose 1-dehydrogenase-like Zn-dependent alcohol dehydrogenase